jgi:hypothetical protein
MEAISGKTAQVSFLGFVFGAGFTMFKWADDTLRRPGSAAESLQAHLPLRVALRQAGAEGLRNAVAVGAGVAISLSVTLLRNGRSHPAMASTAGDPVGAGVGTFAVALYMLDQMPLRARIVPAVGAGTCVSLLLSGLKDGSSE